MEEYIRLEEEKARRHGKMYNWKTAKYGKIRCDEDIHDLRFVETEFPAIVFDDTLTSEVTLSCEPTVSLLNDNKIDFRISFDESDDEDYMVIYDKKSFSYKIICVDNLKTDSENDIDKVNMPSSLLSEPTVMAILVISVSSDSSEDSMGTPAGRVILFGTIPTTIPDTKSMIAPPTTQIDTTVILTETPIIAPTIPPCHDYTLASPDYSPASKTESYPSEYSGTTKEMMDGVTTTLRYVQYIFGNLMEAFIRGLQSGRFLKELMDSISSTLEDSIGRSESFDMMNAKREILDHDCVLMSDTTFNYDLMEKTVVLDLATGQKRLSASLCKLVEKYDEILASQGLLTTGIEYLKLMGTKDLSPKLIILRDRIVLSSELEYGNKIGSVRENLLT
nr:protein transport protein SEC31 homolog B-like isoform X1 [Tanacetum cinerariifolium]